MLTLTPSRVGTFTNIVNVMGSVVGGANCTQGEVAMDTTVEDILVNGGIAAPSLSRLGLLAVAFFCSRSVLDASATYEAASRSRRSELEWGGNWRGRRNDPNERAGG